MIRRAVCVLAAVALVATGCGVRPSGVIPGNEAPSGPAYPPGRSGTAAPGAGQDVVLYFVRGGAVIPVSRSGPPPEPAGLIGQLAAGPDGRSGAGGFTTEVPQSALPATVTTAGTSVRANLHSDVTTLSATAVDQIVCTLLSDDSLAGLTTVVLSGGGRTLPAARCHP